MEHKFPLGSFHRENETTFSGIPFFPEIFQWNEPKSHVPFTTQPEFPEFFGKWKTPIIKQFFSRHYLGVTKQSNEVTSNEVTEKPSNGKNFRRVKNSQILLKLRRIDYNCFLVLIYK